MERHNLLQWCKGEVDPTINNLFINHRWWAWEFIISRMADMYPHLTSLCSNPNRTRWWSSSSSSRDRLHTPINKHLRLRVGSRLPRCKMAVICNMRICNLCNNSSSISNRAYKECQIRWFSLTIRSRILTSIYSSSSKHNHQLHNTINNFTRFRLNNLKTL